MQPLLEDKIEKNQINLSKLAELQESSDKIRAVHRLLKELTWVEIAKLIESSPPKSRDFLWELIPVSTRSEILPELSEEVAADFVKRMNSQQVANLTEAWDADDIADVLRQLPDQVIQEVLSAMTSQNRERVEMVLSYPDDCAGGLMDTDVITVRPRFTLDVVMRYLRRHDEIPASTDQLVVVNADHVYLGTLSMSKLLTSDPSVSVREIMSTDFEAIPVDMPDNQVAQLFEQNDWISAPVVNPNGQVLGRITIDDMVDVIIEEADHSLMSLSGLDEDEDTFAPLSQTAPRRAIWLGVNLITAIIASAVINIFQDTIDKVVALAILMPIVASMGGIAGSQTLTVVIRGMALGKIRASNRSWLLGREMLSGLLNGLLWAASLGVITAWWFGDWQMAIIIGVAIVINLLAAALGGTLLPHLLKRMGIDPALAGGVALTTLTDVVGFLAFLGLATVFYA